MIVKLKLLEKIFKYKKIKNENKKTVQKLDSDKTTLYMLKNTISKCPMF